VPDISLLSLVGEEKSRIDKRKKESKRNKEDRKEKSRENCRKSSKEKHGSTSQWMTSQPGQSTLGAKTNKWVWGEIEEEIKEK
jgi:hypothetical protein